MELTPPHVLEARRAPAAPPESCCDIQERNVNLGSCECAEPPSRCELHLVRNFLGGAVAIAHRGPGDVRDGRRSMADGRMVRGPRRLVRKCCLSRDQGISSTAAYP